MSTTAHSELIRDAAAGGPAGADAPSPRERFAAPSLLRLTKVELRKASDTRAGRWLLLSAVLIAAAVAIARALTGSLADRTFAGSLELTLLPLGVLLPVIGILLVTSEWSQRTALATFSLVPHRQRVAASKLLAALVLGVGAALVSVAMAALGNLVGIAATDADGSWAMSAGTLGQALLGMELNLLMGLGFGLLLMSPALAIVLFFALPTVFTILGGMISSLEKTFEWIDPNQAFDPLTNGSMHGDDWGKLVVCTLLWVGVPLLAGLGRLMRREVK
ncbi:ABC transporter permease subunit [Patulibacter defluvii]|uniref:ABC transporter permease subunit n=1 Tax=Patulibacter defluvii TaxID=3095358 RepID=UPI002A760663|nr:ABC transporter permease subunit [Patulibacter sp. DM4]